MSPFIRLPVLLAGSLLLGCDAPPVHAPAPPPERSSAAQQDAPPRVVSLSPVATRLVIALGAGARLVAVDSESRPWVPPDLPVVDLAAAPTAGAELLLLREEPPEASAAELAAAGLEWVVAAPHDIEDWLELVRSLGRRLVGEARASAFEVAWSRPLAEIGGESSGLLRPGVLAVVEFEPVTLAGGHSFETDLIEIAGGRSLTHAGEVPRLELTDGPAPQHVADLVLIMRRDAPTPEQQRAVARALPNARRIEHFPVASELFWLDEPVGAAQRLRKRIAELAGELR